MALDKPEKAKKLLDLAEEPALAIMDELDTINENLESVQEIFDDLPPIEKMEQLKGEKGDKGDKGEKGDKPTDEEITNLIQPLIPDPIPGKKGDKGDKGDPGKDAEPINEDLIVERILELIPEPEPGKDGSPDTALQIRDKLASLPEEDKLTIAHLGRVEETIFTPLLNRAIGILDQRTQYLLNKRSGSALTLTTTGTSGAATYDPNTGVLNIPQYSSSGGVGDGDYGDITVSSSGTVWTIDTGLNANKIADGSVSNTEFQYLDGVTSSIQTQLNNKQPLDATLTALASFNTNGLLTQTATDTFTGRTVTGTSNRITVTNGDGVSGNPTIDISSSYVGQATITTLGTIATGTWQATKVGLAYGGTNADLSATGGTGQYLKQSSAGAAITVGTIPASDIASGAALTKTDDTNVTLTLGGSPTSALLAATSITVGWTGQLALSRGGTGANLSDPGANAVMVWDDTTNAVRFATLSGLSYNSGTNVLTASGSGGTPGGSDTQVQFNDGGSFGGDAGFTYNKTTDTFTVVNGVFTKASIGTTIDANRLLLVQGDVSGGIATFERTNATTNAVVGTVIIKGTSTGDMADGFGSAFQFAIQDTAAVENLIADIRGIRNGADNTGKLTISTSSAGSMAARLDISTSAVSPGSNDGQALGTTSLQWSDLFLASGAVININNGNWTATHSSGVLTVGTSMDIRMTTAGTNSASVVTVGGTQTLTNKTLTSPVISTIVNTGTLTLPTSTDTLVGRATTDTLTNKRITPRVSTTTSSATPTINTDNVDMYGLTALAVDITSFTTNLSGTPTDGQKLWIYIVGTATRNITWGTSFEASTVALPTATNSTNRLDVGFVWNAATSKWRCVAVA